MIGKIGTAYENSIYTVKGNLATIILIDNSIYKRF